MGGHLSRLITLKEPSLKRDDLLSVLEALAKRRVFPKDIYQQVVDNLRQSLDLNNIILVSSKYVALQLILQNLESKSENLFCSNDINFFYYNQFINVFNKIIPIDINQYSLQFDPVILTELNKSVLFFSYNLGYPVDIEYISDIDILSIADFSGSLFIKNKNKYILNFVDYAICSLKDEEIITSGDGALLYIKDRKKYEKINKYAEENNLYLSDFNSSLLLSQLSKKDKIIDSRCKIFFSLFENTKESISDLQWFDSRKLLEKYNDDDLKQNASFTTFTVDVEDMNVAIKLADQIGIEIKPVIERPISLELKISESFPKTEKVARHAIFIPIYPLLGNEDVERIVYFLKKIASY